MARRMKPAKNFAVSGRFLVERMGEYAVWEKRTTPTVDGVKGELFTTYHVTINRKEPSKAFNGNRTFDEAISPDFTTAAEAIAFAKERV